MVQAVADQCAVVLCQHLLVDDRGGMRIALWSERAKPAEVRDLGPVDGRVTEQRADLLAGRQRRVDSSHGAEELLVHRLVPGLHGGLSRVPPPWAPGRLISRVDRD